MEPVIHPDAGPAGESTDDAALLAGIAAGDEDAFVGLYRRYQGDVYRFAYAMTRSCSLAQDVVQEVFLGAIENAARYDPGKGAVRAWLIGAARHRVIDRLRTERRWTDDLPEQSVACVNEEAVLLMQRVERLHRAIAGLPIEFREVVVLYELEEMSYADTAEILQCPIGTVRSRLHRARAILAAMLTGAEAARPASAGPAAAPKALQAGEICP